MKLEEMSTKSLLQLHNAIAAAPAGPKSFATKAKLIARIESIALAGNIDLASFGQAQMPEAAEQDMQPRADTTEAIDAPPKTERPPTSKGIGRLARELLLDPAGYPHAMVAEMVNARIEGAQATAKSIRWYACNMRKTGVEVPARQRTRPADPDFKEPAGQDNPVIAHAGLLPTEDLS